jgi:SAM-dependent methyltransferase
MAHQSSDRRAHWQNVYRTRDAGSVSWYRPHLEVSLELLGEAGMSAHSRVIDVGGGASTLVDDLLDRGLRDVSVLDVAEEALSLAQRRLGERAKAVKWYAGDVLEIALPPAGFDLWHDRAVLHFISDPADAGRYARIAASALAVGAYAVIGGFAPDGPKRCSGLAVARRSAEEIAALFAPAFTLVQKRTELHRTPAGADQSFAYALLQRQDSHR